MRVMMPEAWAELSPAFAYRGLELRLGRQAGGANAVNMYIDRDIDDRMSRTRLRPIPSGRMRAEAVLAFGILCATTATYLLAHVANLLTATLALSGALAGLAGTLVVLQFGGLGFAGGFQLGLKALIAAVLGGIGSVEGALLGGVRGPVERSADRHQRAPSSGRSSWPGTNASRLRPLGSWPVWPFARRSAMCWSNSSWLTTLTLKSIWLW